MARVLVVEDSENEARHLAKIFQGVKVPVEVAPNIEVAMERIAQDPPALVIASKPERIEVLHSLQVVLKAHAPTTPFVVTILNARIETAIEAMQMGAYDCVAKPYTALDILMASKRATMKAGRMLFVRKLEPKKNPVLKIAALILGLVLVTGGAMKLRQGPPPDTMSLGSVNLSGIQWEDRTLWVGDWFESTVTRYRVDESIIKNRRTLQTKNIFKMQDGQPILVCNTPDLLVTVGADLKIRIHQRSVGLPTFQTLPAPGTNPTGIAWDGTNLWTCDGQTHLLYKHGQDLRVIDTIKSIIPQPSGLSWDGTGLWVIGDKPLKAAKLEFLPGGFVWRGPVTVARLLPEAVTPAGFSVGFGRLWAVSGGDPRISSIPIPELMHAASVRKLKKAEKENKK